MIPERRVKRLAIVSTLLLLLLTLVTLEYAFADQHNASWPALTGRWVQVDLTAHRITAVENGAAVYTAPITSGKRGYETPTGIFYVYRRVDYETMDSATLGVPRDGPEGYYLENVRYVQYFIGNGIALHANYWSPAWVFGQEDISHGCVSMLEPDAAFFWDFATVGTPIVITRAEAASAPTAAAEPTASPTAAPTPQPTVQPTLQPILQPTLQPTPQPTPQPRTVVPPRDGRATVPNVVGLPEAQARAIIVQAGLENTYPNYQQASDLPAAALAIFDSTDPGAVLSSQPSADEWLPQGTVVHLAVRKP